MKNFKLCIIFLSIGMLQMILCRWLGVHDGLKHMIFTHWYQYFLEGIFYSFFYAGVYQWLKNYK